MVHISAHVHIVEGQWDAFRTTKSWKNFVSPQLELACPAIHHKRSVCPLILQRDYKFATECTFQFSYSASLQQIVLYFSKDASLL